MVRNGDPFKSYCSNSFGRNGHTQCFGGEELNCNKASKEPAWTIDLKFRCCGYKGTKRILEDVKSPSNDCLLCISEDRFKNQWCILGKPYRYNFGAMMAIRLIAIWERR